MMVKKIMTMVVMMIMVMIMIMIQMNSKINNQTDDDHLQAFQLVHSQNICLEI